MRAVFLLPLALATLGAILADRAAAEFFAGRGEKSVQAKDWAGAEEQYRKSLEEDGSFHPARYGLAQALLGAGKTAPGIEELRRFSADVKADAAASTEWKALLAKADKQLQDIDAAGAELRKIAEKYADDLLALARKWTAKDPLTAERCAKRVLELRPGDKEAVALLERLAGVSRAAAVPVFNGKDLAGWDSPNSLVWEVLEGNIVGIARDGAYFVRHTREFTGDFDVRCEVKVIEEWGDCPTLGLISAFRGTEDYMLTGFLNRKLIFYEAQKGGTKRDVAIVLLSDSKALVDMKNWTILETRYRKDEITALVNGEVFGTDKRAAGRTGGFIGLQVQTGKVAFRKIEVIPR